MNASSDAGDASGAGGRGGFDGPRIVLTLYGLLVAVGAVAGALVATFVEGVTEPALFGVFALPATPLGFAVYGGVTLATVLGVPLALVVYVSRRIDDPNAADE